MVIKKKTKKVLGFVTTSFILLMMVTAATSVALMSILDSGQKPLYEEQMELID
jgi:hypothetical protein